MTNLLEQAFAAASKLPPEEQDLLAARLLEELAKEDAFDRAIAQSDSKLTKLAAEALEEYRTGGAEPLMPDQL